MLPHSQKLTESLITNTCIILTSHGPVEQLHTRTRSVARLDRSVLVRRQHMEVPVWTLHLPSEYRPTWCTTLLSTMEDLLHGTYKQENQARATLISNRGCTHIIYSCNLPSQTSRSCCTCRS
jgi:hypothetical protein